MLKLNSNYSDYTDETDVNYPEGKAINASSSESFNGTPLLAEFMNDINAAHIAMYVKAYGNRTGISGTPDTQKVSQFADAIAKYTDDKVKAHTDQRGLANGVHGATAEATAGQIVSRDEYGRAKIAAPVADGDIANKKWVLETIYPVGSLYWSSKSTNPSELFGGTWQQIKDRFILAAGDRYPLTEETKHGGADTDDMYGQIQLTESNLPAHSHNMEHKHGMNSAGSHHHAVAGSSNTGAGNVFSIYENGAKVIAADDATLTDRYNNFRNGTQILSDNGSHAHETNSLKNASGTAITNTGTVGSSESFSIMPPYEVAYCWKRIA